jgi:hypothetical protein
MNYVNKERSKSQFNDSKVSIMSSDMENLEASQFDPNSIHTGEDTKLLTPRNIDYREELKSKGMTVEPEMMASERGGQEGQFNADQLIQTFTFFAEITKERANHYKRFRLATINSDISLRTADSF